MKNYEAFIEFAFFDLFTEGLEMTLICGRIFLDEITTEIRKELWSQKKRKENTVII